MDGLALALWFALGLAAQAPSPCAAPPSKWRPPDAPAAALGALFGRAAATLPDGAACVVPVCRAKVTGYAGGFLERDVPDVVMTLRLGDATLRARGPDDAREALLVMPPRPVAPGAAWRIAVADDDFTGSDGLGVWTGTIGSGAFGGKTADASAECRFATVADQQALVAAHAARVAKDVKVLSDRPGRPDEAALDRLLARLELLATLTPPDDPALAAAREVARGGLRTWAAGATTATVPKLGLSFALAPGRLELVARLDASARTGLVLSHMGQDDEIMIAAFGTWVALDTPELVHGNASPSLVGTFPLAPGGAVTVPFHAPSASARELVVLSGWQQGFFGAPRAFVVAHAR